MKSLTPLDFLHDEMFVAGAMNTKKADEFCSEICDIIHAYYKTTKQQNKAIYRSLIMIMHYLNLECNLNDFTIEGVIKLLDCELDYENIDESKTTLDVMMDLAASRHDIIYHAYRYHLESKRHLPHNTTELFRKAWKRYKENPVDKSAEINIKYIHRLFENDKCVKCKNTTEVFSHRLLPTLTYGYFCRHCDCFFLRWDISRIKEIKENFHIESFEHKRKFYYSPDSQ